MGTVVICTLWMIISTLAFLEYAEACSGLSDIDRLIVNLIFILGGPFFAITNILTFILNSILPEGWDDDDDDSKKY
jgi:hypothetical protein